MFANELRKLVNAIQVRSATSLASYAARAWIAIEFVYCKA
jgi:hypothetical protein